MQNHLEIIKEYKSNYGMQPHWRFVLKEILDRVQNGEKGSYKDVEEFIKDIKLDEVNS